jgi:TonB family protein
LHLAIVSAAVHSKNRSLAHENLQAAAKSARQISDVRRSYLLLTTGAGLAPLDPLQATAMLNEAVQAFNQSENLGATPVKWEREVTIEPLTLSFPLSSGAKLDFEESVQKVAEVVGTEAPFDAIQSEQLRAKAFVALAKIALAAEEPPAPAVDEPIVTVGEDGIRRSASKIVMPVYPEAARKKGVKGVAVIELRYDGKGEVTETKVLQAPDATTAQAVVEATRQWKFTPSKLEGQSISVRGKLTFYFLIDDNGKAEVRNPRQYQ